MAADKPADGLARIKRRTYLGSLAAAGSMSAVAGCIGDDDDDETADDDDDDDDTVDEDDPELSIDGLERHWVGNRQNLADNETVFNPWHVDNHWRIENRSWEPLILTDIVNGGHIGILADDWSVGDGQATFELSDEYYWHDGTKVTAEDVSRRFKLETYLGMGLSDFVAPEDIQATDTFTLEMDLRDEWDNTNPNIILGAISDVSIATPEEHYGQFLEDFEAADDDDEIDAISQDLLEHIVSWEDVLCNSIWVPYDASETEATYAPNPYHPNYDKIEFYLYDSEGGGEEGARAGNIDWWWGNEGTEELPDKYEMVPSWFDGQMQFIAIGREAEYLQADRKVRQAIAYLLDLDRYRATVEPHAGESSLHVGMGDSYAETYLTDEVLDNINRYHPPQEDKASELLTDAGFEQEDGEWYTPDGDRWQLNFDTSGWFVEQSQVFANQLIEFGIESEVRGEDHGEFAETTLPSGEYTLSFSMGASEAGAYFPGPDFMNLFYTDDTGGTADLVLGEEPEVPWPPGNPEGDLESVEIRPRVEELHEDISEERQIELASELAWVHNMTIPLYNVLENANAGWANTEEWTYDLDSDWWQQPRTHWNLWREGEVQPR